MRKREELFDDSFDDNRDDSYPFNHGVYGPDVQLSRLVTASARSWQCGGQGFESP